MRIEDDGTSERAETTGLSPGAWAAIAVTTVGLLAWFLIAWLALDRHILDAAGESVGTAFALLVVVSLIGILRRRD